MVPHPFATGTRRQARVHLEGRLWRSRRAWRVGWACCQLLPSSPQTRPIKIAAAAAAKTLTDDISAPSSIHELSLTCLESWHRAASNEPSSFSRCFLLFCFLGDFFPPTPTRPYTARCWSVSARRVFPSFLGDESGSLTYVEHRVQFELVEDEGFKEGRCRARWCNLE